MHTYNQSHQPAPHASPIPTNECKPWTDLENRIVLRALFDEQDQWPEQCDLSINQLAHILERTPYSTQLKAVSMMQSRCPTSRFIAQEEPKAYRRVSAFLSAPMRGTLNDVAINDLVSRLAYTLTGYDDLDEYYVPEQIDQLYEKGLNMRQMAIRISDGYANPYSAAYRVAYRYEQSRLEMLIEPPFSIYFDAPLTQVHTHLASFRGIALRRLSDRTIALKRFFMHERQLNSLIDERFMLPITLHDHFYNGLIESIDSNKRDVRWQKIGRESLETALNDGISLSNLAKSYYRQPLSLLIQAAQAIYLRPSFRNAPLPLALRLLSESSPNKPINSLLNASEMRFFLEFLVENAHSGAA